MMGVARREEIKHRCMWAQSSAEARSLGPADREPGKGRGGGDSPLDLGHLGRLRRPSKSQAWASTAQRARSGRVEHRVDKFRFLVLGLVLD